MTKPKVWRCPHCAEILPPTARLEVVERVLGPRAKPENSWSSPLGRWVRDQARPVTVDEAIVHLGAEVTRATQIRAGRALLSLGLVKTKRLIDGRRLFVYERPEMKPPVVGATPRLLPVGWKKPRRRRTSDAALRERVARWLLDLGDAAVSANQVIEGLGMEITRGNQALIGVALQDLERVRARRFVAGRRVWLYQRPQKDAP